VTDVLFELQNLATAYYGDPDIEIDPDCPIRDMGFDSVGWNDLVAAVESKFQIDLSVIADEYGNQLATSGILKVQTLRQFAQSINQYLSEKSKF
jgi:acyl carrier protein